MSVGASVVTVNCLPLREYFSVTNMKTILRGFVYEYETPKIVTIHSISSTFFLFSFDNLIYLFLLLSSCIDVSINSTTYISLWCGLSNDT